MYNLTEFVEKTALPCIGCSEDGDVYSTTQSLSPPPVVQVGLYLLQYLPRSTLHWDPNNMYHTELKFHFLGLFFCVSAVFEVSRKPVTQVRISVILI